MENDWQICELEDNAKSFTEFTVSAVPEFWIFKKEDDTIWCYWPKANALKKIKSKAQPKLNHDWTMYKCRILMNEEKFSTYKEAVDAEKYCQHFSTLVNGTGTGTENDGQEENVCDSTMDFDVAWYMEVDNDDDDGSVERATEVGNDTFNFNKAVAKGGPYTKIETLKLPAGLPKFYCYDESSEESDEDDKNSSGKSENLDGSSEKHVSVADASVNFDYTQFVNSGGITTSTLLDVVDVTQKADDLQNDDIDIVFSLVNGIQKDFHELKEIAKSISNKVNEPVLLGEIVGLQSVNRNGENPLPQMIRPNDNSNNQINEQSKHYEVPYEILEAEIVKTPLSREIHSEKIGTEDVADATTHVVVETPQDSNEIIEVVNGIIPREIPGKEPDLNIALPNVSDHIGNGHNMEVHETSMVKKESHVADCENVLLPVRKIEQYRNNESLLDTTDVGQDLVKHLIPLNVEDEAAYVSRTASVLFSDDFLLNKVKWRPEENCAYMKASATMKCWKESHETKFPKDIDSKRFMAHIRRIKGAKRAALKAKAKKLLNNIKN